MKQIKITKVDNGFIVEVTKQGASLLKERYYRPTYIVQNGGSLTDFWRALEICLNGEGPTKDELL